MTTAADPNAALCDRLASFADDDAADTWLAYLSVAVDWTGGDLATAMELADAAQKRAESDSEPARMAREAAAVLYASGARQIPVGKDIAIDGVEYRSGDWLSADLVARYHTDGWLTIGGHPGKHGEKHVGGSHVQVEHGTITKGAAQLRGRHIDAIKVKPHKPEESHGGTSGSDGTGSPGATIQPPGNGGQVAGEIGGPASASPGQSGNDGDKPAAAKAPRRVPVSLPEVNKRVDRFEKFFKDKGQHEIAEWMGVLRDHVNAVGGEASLAALAEEPIKTDNKDVQYWGVATAEDRWQHMGDFITDYLARNGISVVTESSDPDKPLVSAYGKPDKYIAGDFKPTIGSFANKLAESKHLPGLETSEDINDVMGKKITHLTPDVLGKMDEKYGKGKWIIKAYGDEAAAGFGIFFPQRAAAIKQDAQNTIWNAGSEVSKYGFEFRRDEGGKVVGLKHNGGDVYDFGTDRYKNTIGGDVRKWADQAAVAADNEQGAMLPDGGKEFMVQPAFQAVGISDAERAAGKTWHEKNEGRVHLVMRDGNAEVIPYATWLKGGNLPVVFEDDDTRAMAKAAVDAINQLPESARRGQVYAPDVMKTADGYRVVELNPQGDEAGSGYLTDNHFTIDAFVSHLTGREPAHVQFIRKLLTTQAAAE